MIRKETPIIVLSLGADVSVVPGSSIVGGQAIFAKNLSLKLAQHHPVWLVTLRFNNSNLPKDLQNSKVKTICIDLPDDEYCAENLWEIVFSKTNFITNKISDLPFSKAIVISCYWLSGYILQTAKIDRPFMWLHSAASYAVQKSSKIPIPQKAGDYLSTRYFWEKKIISNVDINWCTCEYDKKIISENYEYAQKIEVLPRAVDTITPMTISTKPAYDILFIGRIDERKGVYDLPYILENINLGTKITFKIIGGTEDQITKLENWFRTNYPELSSEHNCIFSKAIEHHLVFDEIARAKVLIIPSHHETFCNVILEGIAVGTRVVAYEIGAAKELITNKNLGRTVEPGKLNEFSQAVNKCLLDFEELKPMPSRVPSNHSWDHLLNKLYRTIEQTRKHKMNMMQHVVIKSTRRCNAKCYHCKTRRKTYEVQKKSNFDISFIKAEGILAFAAQRGLREVTISGGEPTLLPNLEELICLIRKYTKRITLITNGWNSHEENWSKWFAAGLSDVKVSIDGFDAETHDWLRGKSGLFKNAFKLLSILDKHRRYDRKFTFSVISIINNFNILHFDKLFKRVLDHNPTDWILHYQECDPEALFTPRKDKIHEFRKKTLPKLKDIALAKKTILPCIDKTIYEIDKIYSPNIQLAEDFTKGIYMNKEKCSNPCSNMVLKYNGDINGCIGGEYTTDIVSGYVSSQGEVFIDYELLDNLISNEVNYCSFCPVPISVTIPLKLQ